MAAPKWKPYCWTRQANASSACAGRPTRESYDAFMRQLLTLIADIRAVSPQPFTLGSACRGYRSAKRAH
ncbi:hypothetical protein LNO81_23445 [Klebsiella variicola subsp. variicola]|nr:hypothetical protein [Klebsiella variicola subsp. variicola]